MNYIIAKQSYVTYTYVYVHICIRRLHYYATKREVLGVMMYTATVTNAHMTWLPTATATSSEESALRVGVTHTNVSLYSLHSLYSITTPAIHVAKECELYHT